MKRLNCFLLITYLLFFVCCSNDKKNNQKNNQDQVTILPIKFDGVDQRIYLPVTFNGETSDFLFDTGCSITSIFDYSPQDTLRKIQTNLIKYRFDTIAPKYPNGSFEIGEFSNKAEFMHNIHENVNILGMNIISNYHWFFDLDKKVAHISRKPFVRLERETMCLNYDLAEDIYFTVKLPLSPEKELNMLFDTGFSFKNRSFVLFHEYDSIPSWCKTHGGLAFQRNSDPVSWLSHNLQIDKYTIEYALFAFEKDKKIIDRFKNIGFEGLFTVDFIHRYQQIYIDPSAKQIKFYGQNKEKGDSINVYLDYMKGTFMRAQQQSSLD